MVARVNIMSLDGIELSDDGRTFSSQRVPKITTVELANGTRKQYVKSVKRSFKIDWKWLPSNTSTSDGFAGRDALKALCLDGNLHTLIIRDTVGGSQTFSVFVDNYSEEVIRRDYVSGIYFYNVSLELGQQ